MGSTIVLSDQYLGYLRQHSYVHSVVVLRSLSARPGLAFAVVVDTGVVLHVVTAALSLVARRANFTSLVGALQGVAFELLARSPLHQLQKSERNPSDDEALLTSIPKSMSGERTKNTGVI